MKFITRFNKYDVINMLNDLEERVEFLERDYRKRNNIKE